MSHPTINMTVSLSDTKNNKKHGALNLTNSVKPVILFVYVFSGNDLDRRSLRHVHVGCFPRPMERMR